MFKHGIGSIALLGVLLFSSGALHAQPDESNGPDNTVLMRTSMGDLIIELDAERAPASVKNFLAYADDGFYTDTLFHRVIDGFMIQGGGYTTVCAIGVTPLPWLEPRHLIQPRRSFLSTPKTTPIWTTPVQPNEDGDTQCLDASLMEWKSSTPSVRFAPALPGLSVAMCHESLWLFSELNASCQPPQLAAAQARLINQTADQL